MSSAKSGSRTGGLPVSSSCALVNAMHSEMVRRTGSGGVKDRHGPLAILDDDLRTPTHAGHQRSKVARRFRLGDVDHVLSEDIIIRRCLLGSCRWRITKITRPSTFGISLDNASAIDNNRDLLVSDRR
jgi:hypothetical protein